MLEHRRRDFTCKPFEEAIPNLDGKSLDLRDETTVVDRVFQLI